MIAKKDLMTFDYKGIEIKANKSVLESYKTTKAITRAEKDPSAFMDAIDAIFDGKDVEYIEALGGQTSHLDGLLTKAYEAAGLKN